MTDSHPPREPGPRAASVPLGRFLVDSGAITERQLEIALEMQRTYGGRLGFNLVDLGVLGPEDLARRLADYHRLPAADPRDLEHPVWSVFRELPSGSAQRLQVVPLSSGPDGVTVAMSDPGDLGAIQQLEFATGHSVRVRVAPEYLIKRVFEQQLGAKTPSEFMRPPHSEHIMRLRHEAVGEELPAGLTLGAYDIGELADPEPAEQDLSRGGWREGLEVALRSLARASDANDTLDAVLDYADRVFGRIVLLAVEGDELVVRRARGVDAERVRDVRLPAAGSPVADVIETGDAFVASREEAPLHDLFGRLLGGPAEDAAGLVPIRLGDRVRAVVYVDGGEARSFDDEVETLRTVAEIAARVGSLHEGRGDPVGLRWSVRIA